MRSGPLLERTIILYILMVCVAASLNRRISQIKEHYLTEIRSNMFSSF